MLLQHYDAIVDFFFGLKKVLKHQKLPIQGLYTGVYISY